MPSRNDIRCALPILILLGTASSMAVADAGHALNYNFRQSLTYDDNVFRLSESPVSAQPGSTSDTVSITEVGAVFDWAYGIQRLKANISGSSTRYRNNVDLGADQHSEGVAWVWRSGNRFDGDVSYSRTALQSSFADLRVAVANTVSTVNYGASANYWFHSNWSAGARASISDLSNSSASQATSDSRASSGELKLRYQPGSGNSLSLVRVRTVGRYPNAQATPVGPIDNGYRQDETGVEVGYRVSGASDFSAGLRNVERQHVEVAARDFRGVTGRFSWNWQGTGQARLATSVQREVGGLTETRASYSVTDTVSLGIDYAVTAKTSFSVQMVETARNYGGDPTTAVAGVADVTDRTHLWSVGAVYTPLTRLTLSLTFRDERRSSTESGRDFVARPVVLTAAYLF